MGDETKKSVTSTGVPVTFTRVPVTFTGDYRVEFGQISNSLRAWLDDLIAFYKYYADEDGKAAAGEIAELYGDLERDTLAVFDADDDGEGGVS